MSLRRCLQSCLASLAFLATLGLGSAASAQLMDGVWLKLTISAKGSALELDGTVSKAKQKFTSYMRLSTFEPEGEGSGEGEAPAVGYTYQIFHEDSPGVWVGDVTGNLLVRGPNEEFLETLETTFFSLDDPAGGGGKEGLGSPTGFDAVFNGEFKVKTDGEGQFKSASFKSFGGVAPEGAVATDVAFAGGFTVKGKSVSLESLPFDPAL